MADSTVLTSLMDVELLFAEQSNIDDDKPAKFYLQSYTVTGQQINQLDYFQLDFEPYRSLALSVGATHFGIKKSPLRFYLGHINLGGHWPLCTIRPLSLEQVKDLDYLHSMMNNYCSALEINAIRLGDFIL